MFSECLGINIPVKNVPTDVETFDTQKGKEGAALASAISNELYRGINPDGRSLVCDIVAELTSIERLSHEEVKKNADGKESKTTVYDESEGKYFKRALAAAGKTIADVQAAVDALPDDDVLDADGKVTTSGKVLDFNAPRTIRGAGKGPNKTDLAQATQVLSLSEDIIEQSVAWLEGNNSGLKIDRDENNKPTAISLANAIKVNRDNAIKRAALPLPVAA
jgi:hypothetical protein